MVVCAAGVYSFAGNNAGASRPAGFHDRGTRLAHGADSWVRPLATQQPSHQRGGGTVDSRHALSGIARGKRLAESWRPSVARGGSRPDHVRGRLATAFL